ncbi:DUF4279 domain-containing protein [Psychrobacillus sp. NEAU-3TGS]|uniref:DUF4279 domain-containing protein n=1 Tax=Psychrobacillus sp. NEAU-3TGS TaxID=2995412 RepID=UPI002495EEF9|nr:DUF4279 domain-containing protein [Psychrobacillus sp. NEAU-3TGS]MDI2588501.1 DUF4279 domain-containing protein [Psychrobacillus sp. NEAU-3TGS]
MEKTNSYTYFSIGGKGEIGPGGLFADKRAIFNPDDITGLLGIKPFSSWNYGDVRKNGSKYLFSNWSAEKSNVGRLDVAAQCMDTIKNLKNKISLLKEIEEQYDVHFVIMIVPSIYGEEQPFINFNEEVIEFCYLTGTTIDVDMYIYSEEIESI